MMTDGVAEFPRHWHRSIGEIRFIAESHGHRFDP
jgi:hypothetical protein